MAAVRKRAPRPRKTTPDLSSDALRRAIKGLLKTASLWEKGHLKDAYAPALEKHEELLKRFLELAHDHWNEVPVGRTDAGNVITAGNHYLARLREVIAFDLRNASSPIGSKRAHFKKMVRYFWPSDVPPSFDVAFGRLEQDGWNAGKTNTDKAAAAAASRFVQDLGGRSTSHLEKVAPRLWPRPLESALVYDELVDTTSGVGAQVAETLWRRFALELAGFSEKAIEKIQDGFGHFSFVATVRVLHDAERTLKVVGPVRARMKKARKRDRPLQK